MKKILENKRLKGGNLTQLQLRFEVQSDAFKAIIRYIIGSLNYCKCFSCQCKWQFFSNKKNKIKYAKYIFKQYFEFEN